MPIDPKQIHALFVVEKPGILGSPIAPDAGKWGRFLETIEALWPRSEDAQRLAENVFLLPLHQTLPVVADLIDACKRYQYPYRTWFLDQAPQWISFPSPS